MYDEITIGNPYFIQTIELLKCLDKLKGLKQDNNKCKEFKQKKTNDLIKLPELKLVRLKRPINQNKYTKESIDEICSKTMILILTHAGFSKVDPDCFELLNDLFKSYLKNLSSLFRKKLDQEMIANLQNSSNSNQLNRSSNKDYPLLLLGKVFNELGSSFSTYQQFNYELVLYRDHVLSQIEELKTDLNLP